MTDKPMTPLDRAARALVAELDRQDGGDCSPERIVFEPQHYAETPYVISYIDQNSVDVGLLVRAVLLAIREPDEAMNSAGYKVDYFDDGVDAIFAAMIDAALSEDAPTPPHQPKP